MNDEADFAMKYSEERKMRIALETRLEALMYESMATANLAYTLIRNVIEGDFESATDTIKTLIRWRGDIEANWFLNAFKPVGVNRYVSEEVIDTIESSEDAYGLMDHTVHKMFEESGKATSKEWNAYAETKSFPDSARMKKIHHEWLQAITLEAMKKKGVKPEKAKNVD